MGQGVAGKRFKAIALHPVYLVKKVN